jgi:hypothetical protein
MSRCSKLDRSVEETYLDKLRDNRLKILYSSEHESVHSTASEERQVLI